MDNLRRAPLPGRRPVPVGVGAPGEGPEHQVRDRGEASEARHGSAPGNGFHRLHLGILRVNLLRRHPIALALIVLVVWSSVDPLPPLVDVATGAAAADADLTRPFGYVLLAPLSDVLDALTFLSLGRAQVLLAVWCVVLALWGAVRPGSLRQRLLRAIVGPALVASLAFATVFLPRPVPRIAVADSSFTVIDYHAHTEASHDGRPGWTAADLARWHAAQGFEASYVTDHNHLYDGHIETPIRLLPGVEWSVYRQHLLALGELTPIDRDRYN